MIHPFSDLLERSRKPAHIIVGLMSGTGADWIDVAVCRLKGQGGDVAVELLHVSRTPARPRGEAPGARSCRTRRPRHRRAARHGRRGVRRGLLLTTLEEAGLSPQDIDLIGSHGQTVYHHSGVADAPKATLQVGDGDVIAVPTGCYVISDFRARDIAAGGEGAPLSPIADVVLFGGRGQDEPRRRRAILNLGGIANLTVLDDEPARLRVRHGAGECTARPIGTAALRRHTGLRSRGTIRPVRPSTNHCSPSCWRTIPISPCRPPKSTGFEMYGDVFVARVAERHGGIDADLMATLTEFVARTVALGLVSVLSLVRPWRRWSWPGAG